MAAPAQLPAAVGYLRFSSDSQEAGDSTRRQRERILAWVEQNRGRARLDTSLGKSGIYTDEGLTGYAATGEERGAITEQYALGELLRHVESGRVPAGSFLVVESADRLSRESAVHALHLITGLLKKRIVVVVLNPLTELRSDADLFKILSVGMTSERAHDESRIKSGRLRDMWEAKRRSAADQPLTHLVPAWCKLVGARRVANRLRGGEIRLDPEKAAVVRRLFKLALAGVGTRTIARRLNEERVPTMQKAEKWTVSAVHHILTARTTIGEFAPHTGRFGSKKRSNTRKPTGEVVACYYPAVVSPDEFLAVQAALKGRTKHAGRRGKHVNLFSGLLVDARSGETFGYRHAKGRPATLVPVHAPDDSPWTSFPGAVFDEAVISRMAELKPSDVLKADDAGGEVVRLGAIHSAKAAELAGFRGEVEEDPRLLKMFKAKLTQLDQELEELAGQLAEAQRQAASPLSEAWGEFRGLADMLRADSSDDFRHRCRTAIRRLVEKVYCVFAGDRRAQVAAVQVYFAGGACRNYLIVYEQRRKGGNGKGYERPARWVVRSFADAGLADGLDLRQPRDAAAVVKVLDRIDPRLYLPATPPVELKESAA